MTEREIDTAIDRAVRDLMDVDTDAAFRARVTARLHRPVRRAWAPRLAAGAVAMLAIAVATIWFRAPQPATRTQGTAARTERPVPSQTLGVAESEPSREAVSPSMTGSPKPTRRMAAPSIPRGTVVAAVAEMPFTSIAPLPGIEPISVAPLANTPIAPPEIVIAPLSPIEEVQISPLEPRTARD
jgi:hypothetical protein